MQRLHQLKTTTIVVALACMTATAFGQWHQKDSEWAYYTADLAGTKYRPLDPDQRVQLQQARSRLALQDR